MVNNSSRDEAAIPKEIPGPSDAEQKPKTWTTGTLTYTTGGIVVLFFWLLFGDFAWSTRERAVGPMAQWYLNHLGVPSVLFGLLISSFPALLWLVLGPIISVKSDRHRGRRGRRIPFLLVMTPVAALAMIGIGCTPIFAHWLHGVMGPEAALGNWLQQSLGDSARGLRILELLRNEMVVGVVCFSISWTVFELATVASHSIFNGLINDVVPKVLLGRFFGLFRAIFLIDGIIFNFWVMGKVPQHFTLILCVIGVYYGAAFLWMCFKVKEGQYPPPPEPTPGADSSVAGKGPFSALSRYFRECFTRPYYLGVFLMIVFGNMASQPIFIFGVPYARSLDISMDTYGKALAVQYSCSLCLSYFIGWLADKFHPLRVVMVTLAGYTIISLIGAFTATTANSFLIAWVSQGVMAGSYITAVASLSLRLYPQIKYAQFASAAGIFQSLSTIVMAPTLGVLIDATGHVYRFTFVGGAILALSAFALSWFVHRRFMLYGGPKSYIAPN